MKPLRSGPQLIRSGLIPHHSWLIPLRLGLEPDRLGLEPDRFWLKVNHFWLLLMGLLLSVPSYAAEARPNVVIIFVDDLGYSDLGCYGAKGWKTPHLDQMAQEGIRFTNFYVSQPVCSASRASLLTGCYANRVGISGALGPNSKVGLSEKETTLGNIFQSQGYKTAMIGKWHLGDHESFSPLKRGFDYYFGLPYSNDMWPFHPNTKSTFPPLPLIENNKIINNNVTDKDQAQLTTQYTEKAVRFINDNHNKPFFLYLAHTMPHVPLYVSDKFKGKSEQGLYGDVIQEIDWSVGEIFKALKNHKLDEKTLVIFTSDNGPWLSYGNHGGTKEPLREGKGSVWEGGIRVPMIARYPKKIPANSIQHEPMMTIDLLPTLAKWIGAELPKLPIDGLDCRSLLLGEKDARSPHKAFWFYYGNNELQAIRMDKWKLILPHSCRMIEDRPAGKDGKPNGYRQVKLEKPMLFNLEEDIGESKDLSEKHPDVLADLLKEADRAREELGDLLTKKTGKGNRPAGKVE